MRWGVHTGLEWESVHAKKRTKQEYKLEVEPTLNLYTTTKAHKNEIRQGMYVTSSLPNYAKMTKEGM
uniref:Uncharacterized protein n=1 Tax=Solanum tuberosum TaxID=4113 RepID=M1D2L7_SOLTU